MSYTIPEPLKVSSAASRRCFADSLGMHLGLDFGTCCQASAGLIVATKMAHNDVPAPVPVRLSYIPAEGLQR